MNMISTIAAFILALGILIDLQPRIRTQRCSVKKIKKRQMSTQDSLESVRLYWMKTTKG